MDVCVIGLGLSGIVTVKHLKDKPGIRSVVAFEKGAKLGGHWVYTEETGPDVHQSSYRDMRYAPVSGWYKQTCTSRVIIRFLRRSSSIPDHVKH